MADMSDVDRLLAEFRAAFEADPRTRPQPFLARVEGAQRRELAALIDGWLAAAPRRAAGGPTAAPAAALVRAERALSAGEGGWRELLPSLRDAARLGRDELAARLADALGAGDRAPKVARYYALMEQGRLAPSGVSDRVLEALGALVGTTAARLRAAGESAGGPVAAPAARPGLRPRMASAARARREPDDEIDRLFTGG
jgi:hypothetical protein